MALSSDTRELITVVQLIRHGSRNPILMYKNMLCTNAYDNPEELGELTKDGKRESYNIGKATRERYRNILGPKYSKKYFKVSSTGSDRTLMSAQLYAAGVYPPTPEDAWHEDIKWHPIPVFEVPSYVLGCYPQQHISARYRNEIAGAVAEMIQKLKETGLIDYIVKNVGEDIPDASTLWLFVDTLNHAKSHGIEIAEWIHKIYPQPLLKFFEEYTKLVIETPFRKLMYTGGFFYQMVTHMENKIINRSEGSNLLVYFGHDTNLIPVLDALKIKNYVWPSYGAVVTFELWKKREQYFVNVYFSHCASTVTEPDLLTLPGDVTECEFHNFKNLFIELMLSEEDLIEKYL